MEPTKKFLRFTNETLSASRKTKKWDVINSTGEKLGEIKFHNAWRTYVFVTNSECSLIFDSRCLEEINHFLFMVITEWKANLNPSEFILAKE